MMLKLDRRAFCFAMGLIGLGADRSMFGPRTRRLRLGIMAPMSGPNSRYGSTTCAARSWRRGINTDGGVGGHNDRDLSRGDMSGTPVEGVSATRRPDHDLDKVDFIIGDVSSSVTLRHAAGR